MSSSSLYIIYCLPQFHAVLPLINNLYKLPSMLPTFFTKNSQALYAFLLRINTPKSSEFSTMAQTKFMFFSLLVLVLVITLPLSCVKAQQASSVFSSYHLYNPDQIGWDLYAVATYCSTYYGDMPLEWRQKYGWTAFCGPFGHPLILLAANA